MRRIIITTTRAAPTTSFSSLIGGMVWFWIWMMTMLGGWAFLVSFELTGVQAASAITTVKPAVYMMNGTGTGTGTGMSIDKVPKLGSFGAGGLNANTGGDDNKNEGKQGVPIVVTPGIALDLRALEAMDVGNWSIPECSYRCFERGDLAYDLPCNYRKNSSCVCAIRDSGREDFRTCVGFHCGLEGKFEVATLEHDLCGLSYRSSKIYLWLPLLPSGFAWFFLGVYFYSRWIITTHLYRPNDYLMMVCTVTFTAASAIMYAIARTSFGLDIWNVNPKEIAYGLKLLYAGEPLYLCTVTLAKLQILTFYLDTFSGTRYALYFRAALIFVILTNLALLGAQLLQCMPISSNWNFVYSAADPSYFGTPSTCINVELFILVAGLLNIFQEILIIVLFLHPILFALPFPSRERRYKAAIGVTILSCITVGVSS
ncbi:hypothetical protein QBC43DRAFT_297601 [Cladorrhinum sp. PSN259]|nr:hypothetical protein QBC43DRAFT_297601 [Cladorrhinum sp. PSN259]